MAAACSAPLPSSQDGTELWMANSCGYDEVLGSVRTGIDSTLEREEFHIYDRDGIRHIDGGSSAAIMYGTYALQRAEVLGQAGAGMEMREKPYYGLRILNHWDNLDDTVERGYAGLSMWEWTSPQIPSERIRRYGSLCASVGINGSVLNNVNSDPLILDTEHIKRVAGIADILRQLAKLLPLQISVAHQVCFRRIAQHDPDVRPERHGKTEIV